MKDNVTDTRIRLNGFDGVIKAFLVCENKCKMYYSMLKELLRDKNTVIKLNVDELCTTQGESDFNVQNNTEVTHKYMDPCNWWFYISTHNEGRMLTYELNTESYKADMRNRIHTACLVFLSMNLQPTG